MYYPMAVQGTDDSKSDAMTWLKERLPALAILGVSGFLLWHLMNRPPTYAQNGGRRRRRARSRSYEENRRGLSKGKLVDRVSTESGVDKREVRAALDGLRAVVTKQLAPGGAGEVTIPGIAKLKTKHVKARKRRRGVNPFTGEEQWFKAKPATKKVKALILKDVRVAAAKKRRKRS